MEKDMNLEPFMENISNKVFDMVQTWGWEYQIGFMAFVSLVCLYLIVYVLSTIKIILRGYPPIKSQQSLCHHDNSLSGWCVKPGGCRTTDECNKTMLDLGKRLVR